MGIAAVVGGIGSALIGANASKKAANAQVQAANIAAKSARLGFDYLKDNPLVGSAQTAGGQAMGMRNALLGLGGNEQAAQNAFQQYQDSTGYQFRLNQGLSGITQNSAVAGLMNSGATAKALMQYGQDIGSAEFGNYLNQLGGVQDVGLNAAYQVASQGQSAGATSAQAQMAAGNARAQGYLNQAQNISSGLGMAMSGIQDMYMTRQGQQSYAKAAY